MNAYIYCAALYCEDCGERIRRTLTAEGKAPADRSDESSYDSDDYPKGPFSDGGGEADSPQYCDGCGTFLENALTEEGERYTREMIEQLEHGSPDSEGERRDYQNRLRDFYDL